MNLIFFCYFQNNCLRMNEADILTLACYKSKDTATKIAAPYTVNPRAFRITYLYERLFDQIRRGFFIVGYKVPDEIQFDGYIFHAMYNDMMKNQTKERLPEMKKVPKAMTHYESCSFIQIGSDSESETVEESPQLASDMDSE